MPRTVWDVLALAKAALQDAAAVYESEGFDNSEQYEAIRAIDEWEQVSPQKGGGPAWHLSAPDERHASVLRWASGGGPLGGACAGEGR